MKFKTRATSIICLSIFSFCLLVCSCQSGQEVDKIDRQAVVMRHVVNVNSFDEMASLTVGNGSFAFTVDATGLQTFPEKYEAGVSLGTMSEWGWHSYPNTEEYKFEESLVDYEFYGRKVPYAVQVRMPERSRLAADYVRINPHRMHLGIVGLDLSHADGSPVTADEITDIQQTLNPWIGEVHSTFNVNGEEVEVTTYAHGDFDIISSKIESPLIKKGLLKVKLRFPYVTGQHSDTGIDLTKPERHSSTMTVAANYADIKRVLDDASYNVRVAWEGTAQLVEKEAHTFILEPNTDRSVISFSCLFTPETPSILLPSFKDVAQSSVTTWEEFWLSGGAVDFAGSTDPRANELERRVVLSQYLTRVQCIGEYPPAETGLTYNSWYGKFHLEMVWWHRMHFGLWNREKLLDGTLKYYKSIIGKAKATAERQGFEGVRWPKMTDPTGNDSPSSVGSFLIWQQPHVIALAELYYNNTKDEAFLKEYSDIIFQTADFMASYPHYDEATDRYILGPWLIPAQEALPSQTTINPPYELAYWKWGLETAQEWRERLNMEREPKWDDIINKLSPLAVQDGVYLAAESATDSYTNPKYMSDHPIVLGTYGIVGSGDLVDPDIMRNTFNKVWDVWQWDSTWGWDFPMAAMAAVRLGMPDKAIDVLLMDKVKNTYLPNGHNYQTSRLRIYLPGNGGLLSTVALMCVGFEEGDDLPGFPKDGSWKVKYENLSRLP